MITNIYIYIHEFRYFLKSYRFTYDRNNDPKDLDLNTAFKFYYTSNNCVFSTFEGKPCNRRVQLFFVK